MKLRNWGTAICSKTDLVDIRPKIVFFGQVQDKCLAVRNNSDGSLVLVPDNRSHPYICTKPSRAVVKYKV